MTGPSFDIFSLVPCTALSHEYAAAVLTLSPERSAAFARALYWEWKNNPIAAGQLADLCSRALASEFSLDEWIAQVVRMYDWLSARGSTALFSDVIEYVSCAFEGSSLQPGHNLDWYLSNFGFERCSPLRAPEDSAR